MEEAEKERRQEIEDRLSDGHYSMRNWYVIRTGPKRTSTLYGGLQRIYM